MNIKILSKIGIILGSILCGLYLIFLLLPFILNFFIDKYTPLIAGEINKLTGLSAGIEELQIVTTPKLTAGIKVKKFDIYTPQKEPVLLADNFQVKMSLLPLITKNIRIDVLQLDNADITLIFNKNGELSIQEFFPQNNQSANINEQNIASLPFGLKLSNHLPDIHIGSYTLLITDGNDKYQLTGGRTDITEFILNKSIKVNTDGKLTLKGRDQFKFNIAIFNKIMPEIELNDIIFNPQPEETTSDFKIPNITEILKGIYNYNVTADANLKLKTSKNSIDGDILISNLSIINLPKSNADLHFKGNSTNFVSNIFTAPNEKTIINGKITTGKKTYLDMNVKSDVEIANILKIVKDIAIIFNISDLQTLSASGRINADFNIKSDTKNIESDGYLRIPSAKLYYGLYKIGVDNINADITLIDNNVNIKNIGFSILGQPLKLFGTISENAVANLHLIADKLSLKGLLIAFGQASLLKENPVYSGLVSMNTTISGKLDKINPNIKLNLKNIDFKNIPADIRVKVPNTDINITSNGQEFSGTALSGNITLTNPAACIQIPRITANISTNSIEITETPVTIEKIKTIISGKIKNYLTDKIELDFVSKGDIKSSLNGDFRLSKQTLNLIYSTTDLSTIVIPMFNKSKMSFQGKVNISGNMMNPIYSGSVNIPSIIIPEIPVTMSELHIKLKHTLLHGSGTVKDFSSGGIKAQNLSSDFVLKGVDFYLNNLNGSAFDGKVNGNIIYNLSNAKTKITFKGDGLNAEKAIEGAAGIKKALTGTLGFSTNLNLTVLDYNSMIKSMKGNLEFSIMNGAFGSIGRFEGFLNANNIVNNTILKNTISAISNASGLATTAEFTDLNGKMTFSDGWANLNPIKSSGNSLCYYITGKYNLLNGTTNVNILGRLDAPMVAKLGVLGQLSADKIIGSSAAKIVKIFTSNPGEEKTSEIPTLTNGSTNYKDFKVSFNGGIDSKSSIKSFKWLSNPDMSQLETKTVKESLNDIKSGFQTDVQVKIDEVNKTIDAVKDTRDQLKNSADEIKNLFKSIKVQNTKTKEIESKSADSVSQEENSETENTKDTTNEN